MECCVSWSCLNCIFLHEFSIAPRVASNSETVFRARPWFGFCAYMRLRRQTYMLY